MQTFLCSCHQRGDQKLQPAEDLLSSFQCQKNSASVACLSSPSTSEHLTRRTGSCFFFFFFLTHFDRLFRVWMDNSLGFAEVTGAGINYTSELCICFYQQDYPLILYMCVCVYIFFSQLAFGMLLIPLIWVFQSDYWLFLFTNTRLRFSLIGSSLSVDRIWEMDRATGYPCYTLSSDNLICI